MRKRLPLLLVIYIGLFIILHLAQGRKSTQLPVFGFLLLDIATFFLFALVPYYILYRLYPGKLLISAALVLISIPALFYLCYLTELLKYYVHDDFILARVKKTMWQHNMRLKTYVSSNIFFALIFAGYGVVFFFIRYTQFETLQQKDSVIHSRQSELSFLRSQINPHFLFNSLNNIYSLMHHNITGAQDAILGLSDMLRYMLYDAGEKVPLQKETDYITRYIALQRLRFEHPIHAPVHITGDTHAMEIPPLLLIPFVENAFKHGDFSGSADGVNITIHAGARTIYFHCDNLKGHGLKDSVGGIGLTNVQRRLDLLYPGKHVLKIEDKPERFIINLEITHE